MRTIDDILANMVSLVREAYDAGKADTASEMKAKVAAIFGSDTALGGSPANSPPDRAKITLPPVPPPSSSPDEVGNERAPMGTVRPAIVRLIRESSGGLTQDEIVEKTGFKANSVRGTLYNLTSIDKVLEKRAGRWFIKIKEGPNAGALRPS